MHRRAGCLGVVRACIQLAASSRLRLPHYLTYTFITDTGSLIIELSYNTIDLSKPSNKFLCSLSSLLRCSEVLANKQASKQFSKGSPLMHVLSCHGSIPNLISLNVR